MTFWYVSGSSGPYTAIRIRILLFSLEAFKKPTKKDKQVLLKSQNSRKKKKILLVDGWNRIRFVKIASHFEVTKQWVFFNCLFVDGRIRIRAFSWPDVFVLNQSVRAWRWRWWSRSGSSSHFSSPSGTFRWTELPQQKIGCLSSFMSTRIRFYCSIFGKTFDTVSVFEARLKRKKDETIFYFL